MEIPPLFHAISGLAFNKILPQPVSRDFFTGKGSVIYMINNGEQNEIKNRIFLRS